MGYIIDAEGIDKVAKDLVSAFKDEFNSYELLKSKVDDFFSIPTSFVLEREMLKAFDCKLDKMVHMKILENASGDVDIEFMNFYNKIKILVKNKDWNTLDVMFGFDSPADHDKNREDMKCRF